MKKWLSFILAVGAAFAATGCTNDSSYEGIKPTENPLTYGGELDSRYETLDWRTETEGEYLLGGYDNEFELRNFGFVHPATTFGKLSISEEQKTQGTASLKIEVEGSGKLYPDNQERPIMTIGTVDTTTVGATYRYDMLTDYTEYAKVAFDFYSELDERYILFYLNVDINNQTHFYTCKLQQGWNSIEIPLTYEKFYESDGTQTVAEVWNFGFGFEKYQTVGQKQIFYLDNFRMIKE